jgi:hypothetical protein
MSHAVAERRAAPRLRVTCDAVIPSNDFFPEIHCRVLSLSRLGARVAPDPPRALPPKFDLVVDERGKTYRAEIVWRRDAVVGVAFRVKVDHWLEDDADDGSIGRARRSLRFVEQPWDPLEETDALD